MEYPLDTPLKRCTACNNDFPATLDYFHAYKRGQYGLRNLCKPCRSKKDKADRQNNYEMHRTRELRYQERHPDRHRESDRRYRQTAKGKQNAVKRQRQYRKRHHGRTLLARKAHYWLYREQELIWGRRYREAHPEHMRELNQAWAKAHPELLKVYRARRRARRLAASGEYTAQDVKRQYARQKGRCYYCHKKVKNFHVDHVIPLSRGGSNGPENIVIACQSCNNRKYNKLPHEWPDGGRLL